MAKILPVAAPRSLNAQKMQMQPDFEDAQVYDDIDESTSLKHSHKKPVIVKSSKFGSIKQIFGSTEKNQENFYLSGPTRIKLTDSQLSTLLFHQIRKFYIEQAENCSSKLNDLNSDDENSFEEQADGFFLNGATRVKITDTQASSVLYHQIKRHYSVEEDNVQN